MNGLFGLPPMQSYLLKKFLDLASSVARGYLKLNHVCSSTDQQKANLYKARIIGKLVCISIMMNKKRKDVEIIVWLKTNEKYIE